MVVRSSVVSWLAVGLIASAASASADEIVKVRVVGEKVTVVSRPARNASVLARPEADTVLEVLSKEGSWFWVLLARDNHGTQKVGWIRESSVEFVEGGARFYPPTETASAADEAAEEAVEEAAPAGGAENDKPAKVEKPKKVDNRKLRRAETGSRKSASGIRAARSARPGRAGDLIGGAADRGAAVPGAAGLKLRTCRN